MVSNVTAIPVRTDLLTTGTGDQEDGTTYQEPPGSDNNERKLAAKPKSVCKNKSTTIIAISVSVLPAAKYFADCPRAISAHACLLTNRAIPISTASEKVQKNE